MKKKPNIPGILISLPAAAAAALYVFTAPARKKRTGYADATDGLRKRGPGGKKGASVITTVIILMLIFPFIVSALIDMSNCLSIKRNMKTELDIATKAAANSVDMKAARCGVYRIADGELSAEAYGSAAANPYNKDYCDAGTVFFSLLNSNGLVTESAASVMNQQHRTAQLGTGADSGYTVQSTPYEWVWQQNAGNGSGAVTDGRGNRVHDVKVEMMVLNNRYGFVKGLREYKKNRYSYQTGTIEVPFASDPELGDWSTWQPCEGYGKESASGTLNIKDESVPSYIPVSTDRPAVYAAAVVQYTPSKIFSMFFGKQYSTIYIKAYSVSELIVSDGFWETGETGTH